MKTIAGRLCRIAFRNCPVAWVILILSVLMLQPQAIFAWEVVGRELNWSMSVPDEEKDWMGGSFYQLEYFIQNMPSLRDFLKSLQRVAKDEEAVIMHLQDAYDVAHRDPSLSTHTPTKITVSLSKKEMDPQKFLEAMDAFINAYYTANVLGTVKRKSQYSFQIHQMTAHEAVFEIRPKEGGMLYQHMVAVPIPAGRLLLFKLEVDSSRYNARVKTFRQMLGSLRIQQ